jgi:branched-chain amino acid transport system substrate-binding protein
MQNQKLLIGRRGLGTLTLALAIAARSGIALAADTVKFGAILPLTGPNAATGNQQQRGIQFAVDRTNAAGGIGGRPVEVLFQDNQTKPDQSVLSFNQLVSLSDVPVIFTGFSGPTLAMAPLATRKKVLLVNGAAQADRLANASPYLINTIPVIRDEVTVLADYLLKTGMKTAAILFENDAAGTAGRDDFQEAYTKGGGKIIASEPSSFSQTDYRPALLKLSAAKPDVVFVMLTDGNAPLATQVGEMKPNFAIAGTSFFSDPETMRNPGAAGWIHTQVKTQAAPDIAKAFKDRFHTDMEFFASQYYNAAAIVFKAAQSVVAEKKPLTGETIKAAIFAIGTFDLLMPTVIKTNTASMEIDVMKIENGSNTILQENKPA